MAEKALLKRKDAIDYNFFAKRVDMLDLAWRELNALGEKNGRDAFTDIYNYANEEDTYLLWREYGDYITNPYVRYTVNRNSDDQYLLLWAYTFWGGVPTTEPAPCGAYSSIKYSTCIRTNFILRKRFAARPAI